MTRILEHHAERLGLDDEALERIRAISSESREASGPLRDELHELYGDLRELLEADVPDEAAVMAQAERIGNVRTELEKNRLRSAIRVRALLTPEQRAELVEIHGERRERRERRREKWRERFKGGEAPPP